LRLESLSNVCEITCSFPQRQSSHKQQLILNTSLTGIFKSSVMKRKDFIFGAFILTLLACGQTTTTETSGSDGTPSAKWVIDTTKMNAIHALKDSMMAGIGNLIETGQAHAPIIEGSDKFEFYELNGGRLGLKGTFSSEEAEVRIGTFLLEGRPAFLQFRDFHKIDQPYGKEMFLYFENGEIFYAEEHKVQLEPGQAPAAIQTVSLLASTRTARELTADFTPYFEKTMKAVKPFLSH